MPTEILVPARNRTPYTGKVHNPRKIFEEQQRSKRVQTMEEFAASTGAALNSRMDRLEGALKQLVEICKGLQDDVAHVQGQVEEGPAKTKKG